MKFTWRHVSELRSVLAEEHEELKRAKQEIRQLRMERDGARAELARCRGSLGSR